MYIAAQLVLKWLGIKPAVIAPSFTEVTCNGHLRDFLLEAILGEEAKPS